jgi:hypothetical protein
VESPEGVAAFEIAMPLGPHNSKMNDVVAMTWL